MNKIANHKNKENKKNIICRREFINCRLTKLEKDEIKKRAKQSDYNDLSEYVRNKLLS